MLPPIQTSQTQIRTLGARKPAGAGFTLPNGAAAGAAVSGAEGISHMLGVFGLEAGWTPAERDGAARRRGLAVLRELQALQLALLDGGGEPALLSRLALLAEGEAGADPGLRDIIDEISLRARIEMARLNP